MTNERKINEFGVGMPPEAVFAHRANLSVELVRMGPQRWLEAITLISEGVKGPARVSETKEQLLERGLITNEDPLISQGQFANLMFGYFADAPQWDKIIERSKPTPQTDIQKVD